MHLTRPKSSKGRSRPTVSASVCSGDSDGGTQRPPRSAVHSRPDGTLRSQSQPAMWQAGQLSQDQVLQMLQQAPAAPPQSLNKYKVLPSIERRRSEAGPGAGGLDRHMSKISLSDDATLQQEVRPEESEAPVVQAGARDLNVRPRPPDSGSTEAKEGGSLLLAIRTPCGRRFQQHFDPSDTLLAVRASAELRYGARYGQAFIQTTEVPRRTFTDLDLTLGQCGVPNRSVLCISQGDGAAEQD